MRHIRSLITQQLTLSNLELSILNTRTDNVRHCYFMQRQVSIETKVAKYIRITQCVCSFEFLNLFSRSRRQRNKSKNTYRALPRHKKTQPNMSIAPMTTNRNKSQLHDIRSKNIISTCTKHKRHNK